MTEVRSFGREHIGARLRLLRSFDRERQGAHLEERPQRRLHLEPLEAQAGRKIRVLDGRERGGEGGGFAQGISLTTLGQAGR